MPGLMTVPEAARWLGMPGQAGSARLRRRLLRLESERGKPIMLRSGGARYVTERILYDYVPEWCPELDEWAAFYAELADLRRKLTTINDKIDRGQARAASLDHALDGGT